LRKHVHHIPQESDIWQPGEKLLINGRDYLCAYQDLNSLKMPRNLITFRKTMEIIQEEAQQNSPKKDII